MLRNIWIALWGLLSGLTVLWLFTNMPFPHDLSVIIARNLLLQLSGVIFMGAMSVAMILAVRPVWLEPSLGGLDKSYRLNKWLGVAGLVTAAFQWVVVNAPKWTISLGILAPPERGTRLTWGTTLSRATRSSAA